MLLLLFRTGVFGIGILLVLITCVMVFYPRKDKDETDASQDDEVKQFFVFVI